MKATIAKAILAFQTTDEYITILFQWYFKGFELLRRYLIKHGPGTNLEIYFEVVDKEIEEDEASLVAQTAASTGANPSQVNFSFLGNALYVLRPLDTSYLDVPLVLGLFFSFFFLFLE